MKEFKIVTLSDCYTEYTVEANTKEEAEEVFWEGGYKTEIIKDYQDERIVETEGVIK